MSDCYCVKNQYTCGKCQEKLNKAAWERLTEKERAYDRYVTSGSFLRSRECTCHLSAPCSFCIEQDDQLGFCFVSGTFPPNPFYAIM